jgi:predicted outer membrane protein
MLPGELLPGNTSYGRFPSNLKNIGMKRFVISIGCALITALPIASAIGKDRSSEDQTFVNEASRGGIMEVKLGELATRNGLSSEVKEFGAHMVKDHTRLNKELGAAATSIGLTVPTDLSEDQKSEYTKLSKMSGKSFDRFRLTNHMVGGVAGGLGLMVAISGRTTPLALVR